MSRIVIFTARIPKKMSNTQQCRLFLCPFLSTPPPLKLLNLTPIATTFDKGTDLRRTFEPYQFCRFQRLQPPKLHQGLLNPHQTSESSIRRSRCASSEPLPNIYVPTKEKLGATRSSFCHDLSQAFWPWSRPSCFSCTEQRKNTPTHAFWCSKLIHAYMPYHFHPIPKREILGLSLTSFPESDRELFVHGLHISERSLSHGWAGPHALHPWGCSYPQEPRGLTERVSGSVHSKGLFLTSKMPLFMWGLNTGRTDARHKPSDPTLNIPKPFITQHPYPGLKSPSHKANNLVVHFSVLLYISDCLSPSAYSTASISFPSDPDLCRAPQRHHCAPTISLGLPHPSMSIPVSPSIPPQFSSAIRFTAFMCSPIAETSVSCSGCLRILKSFTLNWSSEKRLFLQKRRWHQLMRDNHDNLHRSAGPHGIWITKQSLTLNNFLCRTSSFNWQRELTYALACILPALPPVSLWMKDSQDWRRQWYW